MSHKIIKDFKNPKKFLRDARSLAAKNSRKSSR
jgi:hypothetical protein